MNLIYLKAPTAIAFVPCFCLVWPWLFSNHLSPTRSTKIPVPSGCRGSSILHHYHDVFRRNWIWKKFSSIENPVCASVPPPPKLPTAPVCRDLHTYGGFCSYRQIAKSGSSPTSAHLANSSVKDDVGGYSETRATKHNGPMTVLTRPNKYGPSFFIWAITRSSEADFVKEIVKEVERVAIRLKEEENHGEIPERIMKDRSGELQLSICEIPHFRSYKTIKR